MQRLATAQRNQDSNPDWLPDIQDASHGDFGERHESAVDTFARRLAAMVSVQRELLALEVPTPNVITEWLDHCPARFARDMANGMLIAAIRSYDTGDWEGLGQAVVDWAATLELEADKKLARRLRKQLTTH